MLIQYYYYCYYYYFKFRLLITFQIFRNKKIKQKVMPSKQLLMQKTYRFEDVHICTAVSYIFQL
jgi:hypothetical protein